MDFHEMNQQLHSKITSQLVYLNEMKTKYPFPEGKKVFLLFSKILFDMQTNKIDVPRAVTKLTKLLKDDSVMIEGFNAFLPFGMHLKVKQDSNSKKSLNVNFHGVNFPHADELNDEWKTLHEETYQFVKAIQRCCLQHNIIFTKFLNVLHRYRDQKLDPDKKAVADDELNIRFNKILQNREDLKAQYYQLRCPDYLSIISFYCEYMLPFQASFFPHRVELGNNFRDEVKKRFPDKPDKLKEIMNFMTINEKKRWNDEKINSHEYYAELNEILEGHKDLLKMYATF